MQQIEHTSDQIYRMCSDCNTTFPLEEMSKDASKPLGYSYRCKKCYQKRREARRTKHRIKDILQSIENVSHLEGKNFIVVERLPDKTFRILCDCGNERIFSQGNIRENRCCDSEDCPYNKNVQAAIANIIQETDTDGFFIKTTSWKSFKNGAIERNLDFQIEPKDVVDLWRSQNGRCNITGRKLSTGDKYGEDTKRTWSINRIDNTRGYTKDNIELVHKYSNMVMSRFSQQSIDLFCFSRVLKIINENTEYAEKIKNNLKVDLEDQTLIDQIWKSDLKRKRKKQCQTLSPQKI